LLFVTVSSLPACAILALPLTTCGPVGLDHAGAVVKQAEIATTIRRLRVENGADMFLGMMPSQ
jgi:hypothetical protein